MFTIGSSGGVIVWGIECVAYIRYWHWLELHKEDLERLRREDERFEKYSRRRNNKHWYRSLLGPSQPVPAYIGLVSCSMIVLVLSTATWWNHDITGQKVGVAYAGVSLPIIDVVSNLSNQFEANSMPRPLACSKTVPPRKQTLGQT